MKTVVNADTPKRRDRRTARALGAMEKAAARSDRRRRELPPVQALVRAPGVEFAHGDRARPFHTASVGKMMTSTLAFQLAERGRLDLDAPVTDLLPKSATAGLFRRAAADAAHEVTPRMLAAHTSGVADYFEDANDTGTPFPRLLAHERGRRWSPDDLIDFTRAHQAPVDAPGTSFHYSDTGYVLLARVVEEHGDASLAEQLHARVFGPTGMNSSALAFHTVPGGAGATGTPRAEMDIAPLVVDGTDLADAPALSCDWGGGGVVSTLDDLARFAQAWHRGDLLGPEGRDAMQRPRHRFRSGIHYGTGLMELRYGEFFPLLRGLPRTIGHLGVTGAHLFSAPELDVTIVLNAHSTAEMTRSFQLHIRLLQAAVSAARS
ncbi:serine hydrolase domain-containing protein [Microbacterium xanthum]|uniref:serine hydrolase domain-containing protein n=1 Tax=Microbacterium xanthum TaxID=3079794 RepID=UPI002AD1E718|nr:MULTISPECIES: serine hydrolase domain-containing protein [unclassified Microbacterium]MDZ8172597.1 serine hydrolase domain-containing protein [Microbacterium sp. KSW-48]MDZ8202566.1 serine hydrolase domain-containing protein [Microbacterium sp. SSW1-59]